MDHDESPSSTAQPLGARARRFITEYLKDQNGAQAAIRAGYSPSGARVTASRLLANVSIATAIRDAQDEILKETQVTVARIVRELALIAFFDPASILDDSGHLLPISELPPEIRRGLPAVEFTESPNGARKVRFAGKLAALIALGKHMSIFTNRIGDDPTDLPPFDPNAELDDEDDADESSSSESEPPDEPEEQGDL